MVILLNNLGVNAMNKNCQHYQNN